MKDDPSLCAACRGVIAQRSPAVESLGTFGNFPKWGRLRGEGRTTRAKCWGSPSLRCIFECERAGDTLMSYTVISLLTWKLNRLL